MVLHCAGVSVGQGSLAVKGNNKPLRSDRGPSVIEPKWSVAKMAVLRSQVEPRNSLDMEMDFLMASTA
ncbi:MAG: hypothetical protein WA673_17960, partial [Candidatus Acidiferrales bacterium]